MVRVLVAVTFGDLSRPQFEFGGVDFHDGAAVAAGQVVVVRVDDAAPKQAFAAVGHHHVNPTVLHQLLQLRVHRRQSNGSAAAHHQRVELLRADEALHAAEDPDDLTALCGVSRARHVASVPGEELLFGIIPVIVIGMIPKKPVTLVVLAVIGAAVAIAVFVVGGPASRQSNRPVVVSGVSQWAALADQVVGPDATVVSLLTDPNADPHSHEATTSDAAHVAQATLVIENGAGYDTWLAKLVQARSTGVTTVDVASLMGVTAGANPHLFYDVAAAQRLVRALRSKMVPASRYPGVAARSSAVLAQLAATDRSIARLRQSCANVPVAATEDVTGYLLDAIGLKVVTPESLRLAIGNSVDPTVQGLAVALRQLRAHPAFLVNNVQTATPLTNEMVVQARASGVTVLNVTETMTGTNYVTWIDGVVAQVRRALVHEGCAT